MVVTLHNSKIASAAQTLFLCSFSHIVTKNGTIMSDGVFTIRWRMLRNKINQFMPEGKITPVSMHYLRHTYATDLYYAGADIKAAQYLLGHTSIEVTMNLYTGLILDNSEVTRALDSYYEGLEKM